MQAHLANDATGNAVLTLGDGQSITLAGVDAGSLNADDFVFDQTPVTRQCRHHGGERRRDAAALRHRQQHRHHRARLRAGNGTELELIQHGITLQGGGQLTLSDSGANAIFGTDPSVTLTNVDNTISGAGQSATGR